ncbi:hypothetical protein [Sulfuriflexus sp.]|uniref:hypothetical protein n=1 Tax=Sulfuriflexus sp. TaxID=2015443 RepID=UPI0028CE3776|nr:hypothetical protein [Sulfuriflexus sp.]MDT8403609.1 hypothetical protein [Sulfuriflexus sp.]
MKSMLHQMITILLLAGFLLGAEMVLAIAEDPEVSFKEAMQARESGDILGSIEILESIITHEPLLHRARLELAVAYYRAIQYEEAEREAQRVLDDPETPDAVRLSIIAFLAQIRADSARFAATRHEFHPFISVGYLHDTNVNIGPSSDVVNIGATALRVAPGSVPQSDNAVTLAAGFSHTFKTGKLVNIANKSAAFLWQSQAAMYTRQYEELANFNLDVTSLSTGPAFIVPRYWRGNVSFRLDNIELGHDRLALYTSILPSITWLLNETTDLTLSASLADRDFYQTIDKGRDNVYREIGISLGKRYMNDRVAILVGLNLFEESADNDVFSRDGTQIFAGVNWNAWENGSLYANYRQRDYKHDAPEPLFNEKRDEREERFAIGASHEFKDGLLNKWVLNGSYTNTDNVSNVDIYDFDREVVSATLSRTF